LALLLPLARCKKGGKTTAAALFQISNTKGELDPHERRERSTTSKIKVLHKCPRSTLPP